MGFPKRLEPPGHVAGAPCLDDGTIYVTSDGRYGRGDTAYVSAMTADGETTWQVELDSDIATSPTIRDGTIYVRASDAYLALDANSGTTRWRNPVAPPLIGDEFTPDSWIFENFGPAVGTDIAVFPDLDGITAVELASGTVLWRRQLESVRSCPVISNGTVYVSDFLSRDALGVQAFDLETGDREWQWSNSDCWTPPVVSNEHVYASDGFDIVALDQESGEPEWRIGDYGLHGAVQGFSVVGNTVLASSLGHGLACVETESNRLLGDPGTIRWSLGRAGSRTPIAVDDRIVFVGYDVTESAPTDELVLHVLR